MCDSTDVKFTNSLRKLDCIGFPNYAVTVKGDVYNCKYNKYLTCDKYKLIKISKNGKQKTFLYSYLMRVGFKNDDVSPESILECSDDIKKEILETWNFYHTYKSICLADMKCFKDKNCSDRILEQAKRLFVNENGVYSLDHDRYLKHAYTTKNIKLLAGNNSVNLAFNKILKEFDSIKNFCDFTTQQKQENVDNDMILHELNYESKNC